MAMSSLEFKEICVGFGNKLEDVDNELYEAIDEGVPKEEMKTEIAAAKDIISEYEGILPKLDDIKQSQFKDEFIETIDEIKESLTKLEEQGEP